MDIQTTIFQMIEQGNIIGILIMVVLFFFMVVMFVFIGKGIDKRESIKVNERQDAPSVQKSGGMASITAAIGAAVNKYKKNN